MTPNGNPKGVLVATAILLAFALHAQTALACRCVEPSFRRAYEMATIVVVGVVESVAEEGNVYVARLTVEHAWKNAVPLRLTAIVGKACPVELVAGQKYLLYGSKVDPASFGTRRCRGDKLYSEAGAAMAWLEKNGRAADVISGATVNDPHKP